MSTFGLGVDLFSTVRRLTRSAVLPFVVLCPLMLFGQWHAGKYHELTVGKSRKVDVVKVFGNPNETRKPSLAAFAPNTAEELVFKNKSDNGGDLLIAVSKTGTVLYIIDPWKTASPRTAAYRKYGKDWHSKMYSTATCAAAQGQQPLYADPKGNLELIEYPEKGMAFWLATDSEDFYGAIYLAKAPGLARAPACAKRAPKK